MRTRTIIFASAAAAKELRPMLESLGISVADELEYQRVRERGIVIEDDPALVERVLQALSNLGPPVLYRTELVFSRGELEQSPLASISIDLPPRCDTGPEKGTAYDLASGCHACGAGATQRSPLRLRARLLPKRGDAFQTLSREILLSERVAALLLQTVPDSAASLSQAQDADTHALLPWWQIRPATILPPFSDQTSGVVREQPCAMCHRDGYFKSGTKPFQLAYPDLLLSHTSKPNPSDGDPPFPPFSATFERFGNSSLHAPAQPACLASNAALRCLLSARVRGLHVVPVKLHSWSEKAAT